MVKDMTKCPNMSSNGSCKVEIYNDSEENVNENIYEEQGKMYR